MLIRVTQHGELVLEAAEDFRRFSISIDQSAGEVARAALTRIARFDGDQYAWVRQDGLRSLSPLAGESSWEEGLARMLDFAATKGWLDPDGAIRAHIENAEALARQGREALPGVNAQCFKDAMRNLAGGVALVTTGEGNRRSGLTVTAVTSVSAEPPCLLVCVNTSSASHDAILANGAFAVSLLGARHEEVALRFAGVGGIKGAERFLGTDWVPGPTRSPMLTDALCAMDCEVLMHQVVGSHGIFIARVVSTRNGAGEPLVNFQGKLRAFCGN